MYEIGIPIESKLFTNDCVSQNDSVKIIKFSDDTTVEGLISDNNEYAYRDEVGKLVDWCQVNNFELNVSKTKEIIVDFRKKTSAITPLSINGEDVEQVTSFKFLGTTISKDLSWKAHIDNATKKARQRLFFLRELNKFRVGQQILSTFYRSVIESILTFSITVWFGNVSAKDMDKMNKVIKNASRIIGTEVSSLSEIYDKRIIRRAVNTLRDTDHPANQLLQLLPSKKRLRSIQTKSTRFANSFYPMAIRRVNSDKLLPNILD